MHLCSKFELCNCIRSTDMTGCQKLKWWPCALGLWSFESKINRLRQTVEDYYCAKFHVILIRGFRFIVLTYTPTHPHTHIVTKWSLYPRRRTTSSACVKGRTRSNRPKLQQWTHCAVEGLGTEDDLALFVNSVSLSWVFGDVLCHVSRWV